MALRVKNLRKKDIAEWNKIRKGMKKSFSKAMLKFLKPLIDKYNEK